MGAGVGSKGKIISAARELFYRVGYHATSVDDILRHCKVAKSNFYYHFESKEQLGLAVLEERIGEFQDVIQNTLNNPVLNPSIKLEQFVLQVGIAEKEAAIPGGCPFGNFAAALPAGANDPQCESFRQKLSGIFLEMESALNSCLAEGIEQKEFRADIAPADLAAFTVAAVQGTLMLAKTHRDPTRLGSSIKVLLQLVRQPNLG